MDELWALKAGESVDFDGVRATWAATMMPEDMKGLLAVDYAPAQIQRDTSTFGARAARSF